MKTLHFCFEFFVQSVFQLYLYNRCFRKLQNIFFNIWCNHRTVSFWCFFRRNLFCFIAKHLFQCLMKLSNNFVLMFFSTWFISFYFRFFVQSTFQLYLYSHCLKNCKTFFQCLIIEQFRFDVFLKWFISFYFRLFVLFLIFRSISFSTVFVQSLFRKLQNIFFNV